MDPLDVGTAHVCLRGRDAEAAVDLCVRAGRGRVGESIACALGRATMKNRDSRVLSLPAVQALHGLRLRVGAPGAGVGSLCNHPPKGPYSRTPRERIKEGSEMADSDSDDDLFAPKAAATRSGRTVKPAEKYSARPAEASSARAKMLSSCDFLKQMIKEENTRLQIAKDSGIDSTLLGSTLWSDAAAGAGPGLASKKSATDEPSLLERAKEFLGAQEDASDDDADAEREAATGKALFQPVPDICPAPLPVSARMRALLQQCNLPGGATLIERLMTLSSEAGDEGECMMEQWLDAVLAVTTSQVPAGLEELCHFFFRLSAFHSKNAIAHKAVTLASRSLRPGKAAPWTKSDFLHALYVYGLDTTLLPQALSQQCEAAAGGSARYAIGSLVQVKYEEGWFDGRITSFAQGMYTVTVAEDDDEQLFASFPDPDVRPLPPVVHHDDDDGDCIHTHTHTHTHNAQTHTHTHTHTHTGECFQGREALCRHLLHWLWLLQGAHSQK